MKRTTIFITEPQERGLQLESGQSGLSVAELIRRAIDDYLNRWRIVRAFDEEIEKLKAGEGGQGQ